MSKAFTSEETPDVGPQTRPPPRLAPGEVRYVTPEGHAALVAEQQRLRSERDSLPADAPHRADVEARLGLVEATLAVLTVRAPEETPEGVVGFGTWVTIEDEDGDQITWRLVGPDEADARRGRVSVHSPVAKALMHRRVGDTVAVRRPSGEMEWTILAVHRHEPARPEPSEGVSPP